MPTRSEDLSPEVKLFVERSVTADRKVKEREIADKERYRFQRRVSIGAVGGALLMATTTAFAFFQWRAADKASLFAEKARFEAEFQHEMAAISQRRADAALKLAQTTQSLFLAYLASQQRSAGDAGTAALLALEALPNAEAELQLDEAKRELRERFVLKGHEAAVLSAAFSPDGKRIVTASRDKTARLWDAETGNPIGTLAGHTDGMKSAEFSPDGKRVVAASEDMTARLWDAGTGNPTGITLAGHEAAVLSAAFSPDGKRVVTASEDMAARLWDAGTGNPMRTLRGHEAAVLSAAFSPDGKRIVTASEDKTARLWDAETGKQIGEPKAAVPRCLTPAQRKEFFLPPEAPLWCIELGKWPYHTDAWKQWLSDTSAGKNPPLPTGK